MENYTKGQDMMPMIRKMEATDIDQEVPVKPTGTMTRVGNQSVASPPTDIDRDQCQMDCQAYQKCQDHNNLNGNIYKLYS